MEIVFTDIDVFLSLFERLSLPRFCCDLFLFPFTMKNQNLIHFPFLTNQQNLSAVKAKSKNYNVLGECELVYRRIIHGNYRSFLNGIGKDFKLFTITATVASSIVHKYCPTIRFESFPVKISFFFVICQILKDFSMSLNIFISFLTFEEHSTQQGRFVAEGLT